jgi:hypothetical protein
MVRRRIAEFHSLKQRFASRVHRDRPCRRDVGKVLALYVEQRRFTCSRVKMEQWHCRPTPSGTNFETHDAFQRDSAGSVFRANASSIDAFRASR